jgi:RNA polymerase sigma-70 factor (sigma-E family)
MSASHRGNLPIASVVCMAVASERSALEAARADALRDRTMAELFDAHYVDLCRLARLFVGSSALAEEIVQEAFLRTFAGWRRMRDPDRAAFYVRRAVVNLCKSALRRRPVERRGNRTSYRHDELRSQAWEEHATTAMATLSAVRRLPARQRAVIVLRYYLDLSEADIAAQLRTSVGTVKSQLSKAKANLARFMDA